MQMRKLNEPVFLIRIDTQLPVGLNLTPRKFRKGWESVPLSDVRGLGYRAEMCGWQLVSSGEELLKGGLGNTPDAATARALDLALRQVSRSFNAVRVEYIRVQNYPWFCLSTVAVYPQAIQQRPAAIAVRSDAAAGAPSPNDVWSNIDQLFSARRAQIVPLNI
jgi:hypothetical protein